MFIKIIVSIVSIILIRIIQNIANKQVDEVELSTDPINTAQEFNLKLCGLAIIGILLLTVVVWCSQWYRFYCRCFWRRWYFS